MKPPWLYISAGCFRLVL